MNKSLLFTAVSCSLAFIACTKTEDVVTKVTPPPINVVLDTTPAPKKINPVSLSAGLTVGYSGAGTAGAFPATTADAAAPKMDSIYNNRTYYTVNNRYVVIYPRSTSGFIQGYYVSVNGSNAYFKVDYGTFEPVTVRTAGRKKSHQSHNGLRDNGGHEDSTIILKLPSNLAGDVFTVKYAAYDKENRVSNPITAIVNVIASPDATDDSKLLGNWKVTGHKYNSGEWQYQYQWSDSSTRYCKDNSIYWYNIAGSTELPDILTNTETDEYIYSFKANNAFTYAESYFYTDLDYSQSSCSNLVYTSDDYPNDWVQNGGYSYNAKTRKLTFIYDEGYGASNLYTESYYVKELTATKAIVYNIGGFDQNDVAGDIEYYELSKQTK
jgi:hypothetical protein